MAVAAVGEVLFSVVIAGLAVVAENPELLRQVAKLFLSPPWQDVIIPESVVRETRKSPEELRDEARRSLNLNTRDFWNIVVCGQAGVGKSTMINAFLGVEDDDPRAAKSGVGETTKARTVYQICEYLLMHDIPGAGTEREPADGYVLRHKLYAYDVVLCLTGDRLTEGEILVARQLAKFQVPVLFVRTKTDIGVKSIEKRHRGRMTLEKAKDEFRKEVNASILPQLMGAGYLTPRIFFVSAWWIQDFSILGKDNFISGDTLFRYQMDEIVFFEQIMLLAQGRRMQTEEQGYGM
ncbi:P-loop containing nucleoside triphosphate hydrolase protein [Gonapodya prolifera JEL478]|uniref:p-loop containing nucleoside triphosphate hydrolase protein n=1 Tax=Gonapodya prolifera (strain JEL478) TaxID=1344416 RepID=A0A139A8I3_GONPJ|nr:P-loop containing nucleoside triphosphate hydrolase protein [Gonapodya prolifera JEL478]|eukprot:KXS13014.1 P-loop containing nucleoside triphosphate hydrolase protein [Gonapodya prolifera JEL478]